MGNSVAACLKAVILHQCRGHDPAVLSLMAWSASVELLGFDARVCSPAQLQRLRASPVRYLLRTTVKLVCSVDELIWPSVFEGSPWEDSPDTTASQEEGLKLPDWIGPNFPLWAKLREMENLLGRVSFAMPVWKIAIAEVTRSADANQPEARTSWPFLNTTEPSSVQEDWLFLGYDVADRSLLSGLSNCGYTKEEFSQLAASFGRNLNDYHLFDSLEVAMDFKKVADRRAEEHAPFYVYGLWRIP